MRIYVRKAGCMKKTVVDGLRLGVDLRHVASSYYGGKLVIAMILVVIVYGMGVDDIRPGRMSISVEE